MTNLENDSEFLNFEVKETACYIYGIYSPPKFKNLNGTDHYLGVCYREWFNKNMEPDEVYKFAVEAKYYIYNKPTWMELGDNGSPLDFLIFLSKLREGDNFEYSWPQPFENYWKFNRHDIYQVLPWRELLRRHFDQRAWIADRDLIIHKTYLRRG